MLMPLRRPAPGFTLLEVLVAMTIAAVALMSSIRATSALGRSSVDLRARTLAQWSAENRLSEIRVLDEFPNVGTREFDCSQGGVALRCVENIIPTPNRYFRRVELAVFDATEHQLALLTGFATRFQ